MGMIRVKTSELTGAALDWAVSDLELRRMESEGEYVKPWIWDHIKESPHPYSTDWMWGGPIIERELLAIYHMPGGVGGNWRAERPHHFMSAGPTALIAAMRCYVASLLGDTVDVPEELLK